MSIFLFSFFSLCFLALCLAVFVKIKVSDETDKIFLIKNGFRLIFHAGFLIASLFVLKTEMSTSSILFVAIIDPALNALSWFIPLAFASVGVNVVTEGLLKPKQEDEKSNEELAQSLPRSLRWCFEKLS